jgi:hypothetical protein
VILQIADLGNDSPSREIGGAGSNASRTRIDVELRSKYHRNVGRSGVDPWKPARLSPVLDIKGRELTLVLTSFFRCLEEEGIARSVDNRARPKLIFTDQRGRIGTKWYEQLDRDDLLYHLPIRNLPWSNIRRVQRVDAAGRPVEEARYEGMFTTSRSAINAIMQGGTMDVITRMMLQSRPVAEAFKARLILQIHDELVWEVPYTRHAEFICAMQGVLQQPPSADFQIPMLVGFKRGFRFGRVADV